MPAFDYFNREILPGSKILLVDVLADNSYLDFAEVTRVDEDEESISFDFCNKITGNRIWERSGMDGGAYSFEECASRVVVVSMKGVTNTPKDFKHIAAAICSYPDILARIRNHYKNGRKIATIKEIRNVSGCGLKDAREFYEQDLDRWV